MFKNDGYNHIILDLGVATTVDITDPLFKLAVAQGEIKVVQATGLATGHIVKNASNAFVFLVPTKIDADGAIDAATVINIATGAVTTI